MLLFIGANGLLLYVKDVGAKHVTTDLKGYIHVVVSLASIPVTGNALHVHPCALI